MEEKRFVCVISKNRTYPKDVLRVYKQCATEQEAVDYINAHRKEVRLFEDDDVCVRSEDELQRGDYVY